MIVALINHRETDTHAAETVHEAFDLANPDKGDRIDFFSVRSDDPGEARMLYDACDCKHIGTIDPADWSYRGRIGMRLHTINIRAGGLF